MLGKLVKYDIRSTWRDFAAVYISILLGVLILPPVFNHFDNEIVNGIAGFLGVGIAISTIIVMVITLFKIFNTNVFSKEGYLTMTLPATSTQLVVSKLLISSMWIVLTGIVSAIGICIFAVNLNAVPFAEISDGFRKFLSMIDSNGFLAMFMLAAAMILSAVKEIAKLFLACSIAHLKQLNRFRVPVGILSYFVFSWIETLIVQAFALLFSLFPFTEEFIRQLKLIDDMSSIHQHLGFFNGMVVVGILYSMVVISAYALGTIWILNHKLDLD
ncbi:MAG: hypothetical protein PHC91_03110 [Eubacteriales bacterium]|nr:hypothetical protein [Eubacteriales bacterium]